MRKFLLAIALLLAIPALTPQPAASTSKALSNCFRECQSCSAQGQVCCTNDPPYSNLCYCC